MNYLPQKEYLRTLPRKRMGAGALFFNQQNQLLILKTNYKDYWTIPGGVIEKDESPRQAVERETEEEIGFNKKVEKLLFVDYIFKEGKRDENLQFIFYGGVLNQEEINSIKLQQDEIVKFKFIDIDQVDELMNPKFIKRKPHALKAIENNTVYYLENGRLI